LLLFSRKKKPKRKNKSPLRKKNYRNSPEEPVRSRHCTPLPVLDPQRSAQGGGEVAARGSDAKNKTRTLFLKNLENNSETMT